MLKHQEEADPKSCWNKARYGERIFVILERDKAAPATIRAWAAERIRLGLNDEDDPQILSALQDAQWIEEGRKDGHEY